MLYSNKIIKEGSILIMTQINVVITRSLEEECLHEITAVSPEIKLWDASDLVNAEQHGRNPAQCAQRPYPRSSGPNPVILSP